MERNKMQTVKLENWAVVTFGHSGYQSPEQATVALTGNVYGHPNPKNHDGKEVVTSDLKSISVARLTATTKNTVYELGTPHPDFVKYLESIGKTVEDYETVGVSGAV